MRSIAAALALAACATCLPHAAAQEKRPAPAKKQTKQERVRAVHARFDRFDKDGNGLLEGKELPKNWLTAYDANDDGKVGKKEFTRLQMRPPKLRRLHHMRDPVARARWTLRQFDRNQDGKVEREEFPGSNAQFRQADRNRDDSLSQRELLRRASEELDDIRSRMKRPNRREFLDFFDIDRNRRITASEYDGPLRVFRKYDKNEDGEVGYYELYPEYAERDRRQQELYKPKPEDLNVVEAMDKNGDKRVLDPPIPVLRQPAGGADYAERRRPSRPSSARNTCPAIAGFSRSRRTL
jgi:Ca2+-binding EF-hand superfamily protein